MMATYDFRWSQVGRDMALEFHQGISYKLRCPRVKDKSNVTKSEEIKKQQAKNYRPSRIGFISGTPPWIL